MQDILIVVDMQNDFITGALGTPEAQAIVERVADKMRNFNGRVMTTRDTHEDNYLDTQEGRLLPVPHCIRGSWGWQLHPLVEAQRGALGPPGGQAGLRLSRAGPDAGTGERACTHPQHHAGGPVHGHLCHLKRVDFAGVFARNRDYCGRGLLCGCDARQPSNSADSHEGLSGED